MANKFLDANGVLYLWQKIKNMFVAKEDGKGLSSNDYTTPDKTKLSGIEAGATKTVVEDILTSTSSTNALSANKGKELDEKINAINRSMEDLGGGDMVKSNYDTDNNGQVDKADDADKFGGQTPDYYATADAVSKKANDVDLKTVAKSGSYNDLIDKPFGEIGTKIEWDGTPTSTYITFTMNEAESYFYKVAEPIDTLVDCVLRVVSSEGENEMTIDSNTIQTTEGGENGIYVMNVKVPNSSFNHMSGNTLTFEEAGLYFFYVNQNGNVTRIISLVSPDYDIKKIDKEFLPDDIKVELPENLVTTDENGLIPDSMLPSYVDDVVEGYYNITDGIFYKEAEFTNAITGESGKIYLDISTSPATSYRFGGTTFVPIASSDLSPITNAEIDTILAS